MNYLAILISGVSGFVVGTLAGSDYVRFLIWGRFFWAGLLRQPLISAEVVASQFFRCKDGVVAINGIALQNNIPFVSLENCSVNIRGVTFPWRIQYNKYLSRNITGNKINLYDGSIEDLCNNLSKRIEKYARYQEARITLPKNTKRTVDVLIEIQRKKWEEGKPLHEIFESNKGKYHLAYAETMKGKTHLTPLTLDEGWNGYIGIFSDKLGLIESFEIEIPENTEKYVDWSSNKEIPEERTDGRGYPLRLKIKR